jgi:hypothetical protein
MAHGISPLLMKVPGLGAFCPRRNELKYLLRDDFVNDVAAGSVDGTDADPGPGSRTAVDTGNNLSLSGGKLSFTGGLGTPSFGNPGLWYEALAREPGRMLLVDLTAGAANHRTTVGWDNGQAGPPNLHGFYLYSDGSFRAYDNAANLGIGIDFAAGTKYKLAIILRATGAFYFMRIAGKWELVFVSDELTTASCYPGYGNYQMVCTSTFMRVPKSLWLPAAVVSDGFGSVPSLADQGSNQIALAIYGPVSLGAPGSGDGLTAAYFNMNDACLKIGGATFDAKFNGDYGTAICLTKLRSAADWNDTAAYRYTFHARDALADTNYVVMGKSNVANELVWRHRSGGLVHNLTHDFGPSPTTDWFSQAMTWDVDADGGNGELKAFVDGVRVESAIAIDPMEPRDWSATGTNVIGAGSLTQQEWPGSIAHMILSYGVCASEAEMLTIYNALVAGTLTSTILDGIFGEAEPGSAGNWSWWKLDEQFISDGLGHAEGVNSSLGSGGKAIPWIQEDGFWTVANGRAEVANLVDSKAVATVDAGSRDVVLIAEATRAAGEVGIVARYQDDDNYLRAFHDGTNCRLVQRVGGAQSTLFSSARTYQAGAPIKLVLSGNRAALFYNHVAVNDNPAIVDPGLTSTRHGLYSTDGGNTVDNLRVWRAGTAGEYYRLERYADI